MACWMAAIFALSAPKLLPKCFRACTPSRQARAIGPLPSIAAWQKVGQFFM